MKKPTPAPQSQAPDVLSDVPPPAVVRQRITHNRREAMMLRQLLKLATRKAELANETYGEVPCR